MTLSACETGISEVNDAQELLGLTRALLFAGADSLIVSLWKVPDAATAEIMSDFYGQLGRGTSKADALRAAVLRARDKHGTRFDRWAGFELSRRMALTESQCFYVWGIPAADRLELDVDEDA